MSAQPVVDLHCDLLSFLTEAPSRTPEDPDSKASYPQMQQGGVSLQILAVYTETGPDSHLQGRRQGKALEKLLRTDPDRYALWNPTRAVAIGKTVQVLPAIENANAICGESLPLTEGLSFLETMYEEFKRILYVSLTWNGENRFGGGCGSKAGLKEDGKRILEWMDRKKIAVDLSHASDFLADGILNFLDKKSLDVPVCASHSNLRSVHPEERNLPDEIAKEIFRRKGLIGLNLFAPFVGREPKHLLRHIQKVYDLGGKQSLCFGADFFSVSDFDYLLKKYGTACPFFPEFPNASCYQDLLSLLKKELLLPQEDLASIACGNFKRYADEIKL